MSSKPFFIQTIDQSRFDDAGSRLSVNYVTSSGRYDISLVVGGIYPEYACGFRVTFVIQSLVEHEPPSTVHKVLTKRFALVGNTVEKLDLGRGVEVPDLAKMDLYIFRDENSERSQLPCVHGYWLSPS